MGGDFAEGKWLLRFRPVVRVKVGSNRYADPRTRSSYATSTRFDRR